MGVAEMALTVAGLKVSDMKAIKTHNPFAVNDVYMAKQMGVDIMGIVNNYGSPIAYGVLESQYKPGLSIEEGTVLAARAIHNAMKRDSASGDKIELVRITDKYEEVGGPEFQEIMNLL